METMIENVQWKKLVLKSLKVAVGCSAAIYIAHLLQLEYEIAAGTITLLTLVTTKWETLRLSGYRIVTLLITVCLSYFIFEFCSNIWIAYGLFIFLLVMVCDVFGWAATLSVNAVIGAHFLTSLDFSGGSIYNEFMLVVIGISLAIVLNLFHLNLSTQKQLVAQMRYVESRLQFILGELAAYLSHKDMQKNVWDDICDLERVLKKNIQEACEYQENTFSSHPGYYIEYFEMRMQQTNVLHNLHYEMKKIRNIPDQAEVIAKYMLYLMDYVIEKNVPKEQMDELNRIFEGMKKEPLPKSREEFENRAILYHVLMDLEDFLVFKRRFVEGLDDVKRKIYWKELS